MAKKNWKPILKLSELKAGLYIRAIVSGDGQPMIHMYEVVGKPFRAKTGYSKKAWKVLAISVNKLWPSRDRTDYYAGDLVLRGSHTVKLYRFSNGLLNHLEALKRTDKRQYAEFLRGGSVFGRGMGRRTPPLG